MSVVAAFLVTTLQKAAPPPFSKLRAYRFILTAHEYNLRLPQELLSVPTLQMTLRSLNIAPKSVCLAQTFIFSIHPLQCSPGLADSASSAFPRQCILSTLSQPHPDQSIHL